MNVVGVLGALLLGGGAPAADVPVTYPSPVLVSETRRVEAVARGDFEGGDAVMLVYTDAWPDAFSVMVEALTPIVPVVVLVEQGLTHDDVAAQIESLHEDLRVRVWNTGISVDSAWVRDYGPFFVADRKGRVAWIDTAYSKTRKLDEQAVVDVMRGLRIEPHGLALVEELDGGALVSNGRGLCVSTVEYFASIGIAARAEVAIRRVGRTLGCQHMLLVPGLAREETHHADLFVQFVGPDVAVVAEYDPATMPEDAARMDTVVDGLLDAARRLSMSLEVVRIPSPAAQGRRYATYVNFFRLDPVLLVPSYGSVGDRQERSAYLALSRAMPDTRLVPVPSSEMLLLGGSVHCVTKELPLRTVRRRGRGGVPGADVLP
jgi:agmatine deiminase